MELVFLQSVSRAAANNLNDEEEYAQLLEHVKKESKRDFKPLMISVSPPFVNVANGFAYYLITFPKAGKLFLLKPEFM